MQKSKLSKIIPAIITTCAILASPATKLSVLLDTDTALAADAAAAKAGRAKKWYRVNTDTLNVRCSPDPNSPAIGTLTRGLEIKVSSIHHGWAKFKFQGCTAYVSRQYLKKIKPKTD